MFVDITLLLGLFLLNGVFAMSEIALISARRSRLLQLAAGGQAGASRALLLSEDPTRFLSTVQVGITCIGILSGAVGEYAIADRLRVWIEQVPLLAPHAATLSLVAMVAVLTYVSLIVGELVPKRLGLTHPERIASLVARPMTLLASAGRPLVYVLSRTTDAILAVLRVSRVKAPAVTPEEIKVLMEQGAEEGVFDRAERDLVANVLHLDDRQVGAVLTPRAEIVFLDVLRPPAENQAIFAASPHGVLPLCRGGLDDVIGFVRSTDMLAMVLRGRETDLARVASPPLFVPTTVTLMALLQQFKQTHLPIALVVDEFGSVAGLVSLTDVTTAIVGDLPAAPDVDPDVVTRADGTLLVDGGVEIHQLARRLDATLADAEPRHYHTLGGLAMDVLGRIPRVGDLFERAGHRFEIVDMDGNRVDRLLVTPAARGPAPAASGGAGVG
jgi:putative hemolysin